MVLGPLGRGAHSEVYKVRSKAKGNEFALKIINKEKVNREKMTSRVRNEVQVRGDSNIRNLELFK